MIASKLPRYFLFALVLGVGVTIIMLSMFYGQYRWLAGEIVARSSAEHDTFLEASFERRMRTQLTVIADELALDIDASDSGAVHQILNRAMANDELIAGLQFTRSDLQILRSGELPATAFTGQVNWTENELVLIVPVAADGVNMGELAGSIHLGLLRAESTQFASEVVATEVESRRISFVWIGFGYWV